MIRGLGSAGGAGANRIEEGVSAGVCVAARKTVRTRALWAIDLSRRRMAHVAVSVSAENISRPGRRRKTWRAGPRGVDRPPRACRRVNGVDPPIAYPVRGWNWHTPIRERDDPSSDRRRGLLIPIAEGMWVEQVSVASIGSNAPLLTTATR